MIMYSAPRPGSQTCLRYTRVEGQLKWQGMLGGQEALSLQKWEREICTCRVRRVQIAISRYVMTTLWSLVIFSNVKKSNLQLNLA